MEVMWLGLQIGSLDKEIQASHGYLDVRETM